MDYTSIYPAYVITLMHKDIRNGSDVGIDSFYRQASLEWRILPVWGKIIVF